MREGSDCPRKHVQLVACQNYLSGSCPLGPDCPRGHPKPNLPTGEDYGPPSPPSPCYLGPPPPTGNNIIIIFRELLSSGYRCTSQVVFVSTLAVII
ncbi:hypothetical protein FRC02_001650 [Tulasnella sp. 418]|nr:hypothetical protein FRC02_001650 [Tulasnella sp. 418]